MKRFEKFNLAFGEHKSIDKQVLEMLSTLDQDYLNENTFDAEYRKAFDFLNTDIN